MHEILDLLPEHREQRLTVISRIHARLTRHHPFFASSKQPSSHIDILQTAINEGQNEMYPSQSSISLSYAASFYAMDNASIYVLGTDRKLWLEHAQEGKFGSVPPPREQVDGNVAAFKPLSPSAIYVMGTDRKLWLEQSVNGLFGAVPPPRQQVDANVEDFQPLDGETIYVLGTDGKLWLEHAPFNNIPPKREQVDGNVAGFQALSATVVYAWHGWKFVA